MMYHLMALPRALWSILLGAIRNEAFQGLSGFAIVLIGGGSAFYWKVEGWSYLDSLYFSVVTLTTVGYGDFSPDTDAGKLFTIFYILVGLGIVAAFISSLASSSIDVWNRSGDLGLNPLATRDQSNTDDSDPADS
jgi:hypothetical protein